jgi:hypothetical protein
MTVGAFPCYLLRVPEKAENGGIVEGELGEKGNRVHRKGPMYRALTGSVASERFGSTAERSTRY